MVTSEITVGNNFVRLLPKFGQGNLLGFGQNASEIIPYFHKYSVAIFDYLLVSWVWTS